MNFSKLFRELKRRNVFRVATAYAIAGWLIIQVATSVFPAFNFPEWTTQFVIILVIAGLPISIIIAWAFELTPEGLKKTDQVDRKSSITSKTGRKIDRIIILSLSVLIIILVGDRIFYANNDSDVPPVDAAIEQNTNKEPSIAVLPFEDLSEDGDQAFFGEGLSEELLNVLVRVEGMDVASRTSAFQFKDRGLGIPEIAQQLNVQYIVEGSIRKSGDQIRVTAQLIESGSDRHLWSETYDRALTAENLFNIQDEISASIVSELSSLLDLKSARQTSLKTKTKDLTAYELFLEARGLFQARNNLSAALEMLEKTIVIDPFFAEAYAMKAAVLALLEEYKYDDQIYNRERMDSQALSDIEEALKLDPENALAYATKGLVLMSQNRELRATNDIKEILEYYNRALELDPYNASAYNWRGLTNVLIRNMDAAITDFQECIRIEERYYPCYENLIQAYAAVKRDDLAFEIFKEALGDGVTRNGRTNIFMLSRLDKRELFMVATNDALLLQDWNRHSELYESLQSGRKNPELAKDIMNYVQQKHSQIPFYASLIITALGNYEIPYGSYFVWDPALVHYRKTDNFKNLIKKRGAWTYWNEFGYPERCRPIENNDFECD